MSEAAPVEPHTPNEPGSDAESDDSNASSDSPEGSYSDDSDEDDVHTDDGDTDAPDDASHCPSSSEEEEDDDSDDDSKRRVRHRKQKPTLRAVRSTRGMPPPAKQRELGALRVHRRMPPLVNSQREREAASRRRTRGPKMTSVCLMGWDATDAK